MNKNIRILRWLLFAGSLYFFLVTTFHMIGVNIQVINTDFGVASNLNGYFYIDNVSVGCVT